MSDFERCFKAVLVHEGGKVDHPKDPGGRTAYGVIQRVYDGYRKNKNLPRRDVFLIEPDEIKEIYRKQYWDAIRGDRLPPGVSYIVYDGAVNSGPSQSVKWLQRALGLPVIDGRIGEATVAAACDYHDHKELVAKIAERRMAFLRALKTFKTFGKGWTRRVTEAKARGQAWATGAAFAQPAFIMGGEFKAPIEDAEGKPSRAVADATTGGGVASGGLAGILQQAQDTLEPYATVSDIIQRVVLALVIIGIVATAGGFIYTRWAKRRAEERADALDLPVTS